MRRILFGMAREFKKFFLHVRALMVYKMFGCFLAGKQKCQFFCLPL